MFQPMFVPPRDNPFFRRLGDALIPSMAPLVYGLRGVDLPEPDRGRLRESITPRALVSPNHPSWLDTVVVLWLSQLLGRPFNYLAAREIMSGLPGWVLNQLGAYSVIRGVPDRESLRTTRKLLAERDRTVVIFPEGEIYEHNDKLLAFQSGVAQIGFWALEDLQKQDKDARLPVVPVAIKYRCVDSPRPAIENSLKELERALGLPEMGRPAAYARLRRVADRVLATLERDSGLKPQEGEAFQPRIEAVRHAMLHRVARAIGGGIDERQPPADQLHMLFHDLKSWVGLLPDGYTEYDERLYRRKMEIASPLFGELNRLQNFIAVTGDYVAAEATAERFLDVLGRLEKEVFGKVRYRVPREAMVRVDEPIRLEERYEQYRTHKREAVAQVTRELEDGIRRMLRELSAAATPISLEI